MLRWSIYCAVTKKKMRQTVDWNPYYEIADGDMPYRDKLRAYADIGRQRMEVDRFEEFCDAHLGHLDEVAWEFFGSPAAREAVHLKVQSLFPPHEVDEFTEYFWNLLEQWRQSDVVARRPAEQPAEQPAR